MITEYSLSFNTAVGRSNGRNFCPSILLIAWCIADDTGNSCVGDCTRTAYADADGE